MTGYEEIITDPSYVGQAVVFTYPLIGNYGITRTDAQSDRIQVEAVIVRESALNFSNYRASESLEHYLRSESVLAVEGIDTRALTRQIRSSGTMKGGITTEDIAPEEFLQNVQQSPSISEGNLYHKVMTDKVLPIEGNPDREHSVLALDFGIKRNIIDQLKKYFKQVFLVPFDSSFSDTVSDLSFDAVFLSNGPGDPRNVKRIKETILELSQSGYPLFAICFGHQLIGKAFDLPIFKLPFGHHGGNHPVKNIEDGKVYITAQNHNYAISAEAVEESPDWELTWINLYDSTVEGIRHKELPIYSIQFHPEASPGPHEASEKIFNDFFCLVREGK